MYGKTNPHTMASGSTMSLMASASTTGQMDVASRVSGDMESAMAWANTTGQTKGAT